ncbi:DUF7336 domain-containing protein [Paenibacillus methanolicus]|uniref:DUF7336 domain-containing protein n=1 Tax=Paenibacillus methanolicus TaxID=582686 RepID=A0A5S5C1X8_9BACL|nr:hypothetical protein [Paenibacillus methanolicus]TYP73169.1 hypothetical protein BCM02_107153 [Paenibacillus methanolicus]
MIPLDYKNDEEKQPLVYLVQHAYDLEEEIEVKIIGIFSSLEKAEAAVEEYKKLEGFRDYPDGFTIGPCILDRGYWDGGFVTVYHEEEE